MTAEEEISKYPVGFRFHPFDEELITDYLKPVIMGKQLPCNIIKFGQVYGPASDPWHVLDPNDHSWFLSPELKKTEKCTYVFAELSKLSRSTSGAFKNTSKKAGCGTWCGKTARKQIKDENGNVIGEKRYLVFEINEINSRAGVDLGKVGLYKMHEYCLSGINAGLISARSIVLCKITCDSTKECPVNLKTGAKSSGNVSRSTSSNAYKKEETISKNLEGTSSATAENLTVIGGGVDDGSAATQFQNLDDFLGDLCCDDLGGEEFCLGDLAGEGPCFDADWLMGCLDSNQQEGPIEDNTTSNLGKRKFEAEEDSCQNKKTCL